MCALRVSGSLFRHWIYCFSGNRKIYFIICAFVMAIIIGSYPFLNRLSLYAFGQTGLVTVSYGINRSISQLPNSTMEYQHSEAIILSKSAFSSDNTPTTTPLTSAFATDSSSTTTLSKSAITSDSPSTTTPLTNAFTTDSPSTTTLLTSAFTTDSSSTTTHLMSAFTTDSSLTTTLSTSAITSDSPSTTTPLTSAFATDSSSTTTLSKSAFTTDNASTTLSTRAFTTDSSSTTPLTRAFTTGSPPANRNWSRYIVDTPTCRIPSFDPRDPEVMNFMADNLKKIECGNPPLTSIVNRQFIINHNHLGHYGVKELNEISCCYQIVTRDQDGKSDSKIKFSKDCEIIDNGTFIDDEFTRVQCSIHQNSLTVVEFHAIIPLLNSTYDEAETNVDHQDRFSVMAIGFDSTSRLNFQRHMPKTRKYLLQTMGTVEMFGYTKVGDNTFPNLVPVLTGLSSDEIEGECWKDNGPLDNCTWIWKLFKENGYTTVYGEDGVYLSTFNYLKSGFLHQPTDYYLRPFLIAAEKETAHNKFFNTRLCLSPRPLHKVMLEWGKQFMETKTNVSYFGFVWSNSLTHDDHNLIQLADGYTSDMLHDLYTNGHLDRTILILMSDHGMRWGSLRHTTVGQYENRLPALYVYVPLLFRKRFPRHYKNLQKNSHRITSPYDIHHTFLDILRLQTSSNNDAISTFENAIGISLFSEIGENRTCQDAGIDNQWCACDEIVKVNENDSIVIAIATFIVDTINNLTEEVRNKCAKLSLKSVFSAGLQSNPHLRDNDPDERHYRVSVLVEPSGGIFEATVIYRNSIGTTEAIEGDITRMNLYGNQSYCVDDIEYKSFCYCL